MNSNFLKGLNQFAILMYYVLVGAGVVTWLELIWGFITGLFTGLFTGQ